MENDNGQVIPRNSARLMEFIAEQKDKPYSILLTEQEYLEGNKNFLQHLHDERVAIDELRKHVYSLGKTFERLSSLELRGIRKIVRDRLLSEGKTGPAGKLIV